MVSSRILNRFSLSAYPALQYLRSLAETVVPSFILAPTPKPKGEVSEGEAGAEGLKGEDGVERSEAWGERMEAEKTAEGWLREYPCTLHSFFWRSRKTPSLATAFADPRIPALQTLNLTL